MRWHPKQFRPWTLGLGPRAQRSQQPPLAGTFSVGQADSRVRARANTTQNRFCRSDENLRRQNFAEFREKLGLTTPLLPVPRRAGRTWLCWQSAANVSPLPNSQIHGKIQGISARLAPPCPPDTDFSVLYQQEIVKFPKLPIREFFGRNREFLSANRDLSCGSRRIVQTILRRSA